MDRLDQMREGWPHGDTTAVGELLDRAEELREALRQIEDQEGREGMTDWKFAEATLEITSAVLAKLEVKPCPPTRKGQ